MFVLVVLVSIMFCYSDEHCSGMLVCLFKRLFALCFYTVYPVYFAFKFFFAHFISMNDTDAENSFYNYLNSIKTCENSEYFKFNYYTTDEFGTLCDDITVIIIFHLNIRSLNRNSEELFQLMQSINPCPGNSFFATFARKWGVI